MHHMSIAIAFSILLAPMRVRAEELPPNPYEDEPTPVALDEPEPVALETLAEAALVPAPPPTEDTIRQLDDVLEAGEDPIAAIEEPEPEPADVPSRAQTAAAIEAVTADVRECAAGQRSATVQLRFVFLSNGRVTTAYVDPETARLTPRERTCMARIARRAQLPSFARRRFEVTYSVRL